MPAGRLSVVVTRRLPEVVETRMKELFDVTLRDPDIAMTREELAEAMRTCDVLVPTITDTIDAALIEAAGEQLKMIANFGAGIEHIDLSAARARKVIVTNTPGVFTDDTADITLMLILSVPRRVGEGSRLVRDGQWTGWAPTATSTRPAASGMFRSAGSLSVTWVTITVPPASLVTL